jgi:hypothetical protein
MTGYLQVQRRGVEGKRSWEGRGNKGLKNM